LVGLRNEAGYFLVGYDRTIPNTWKFWPRQWCPSTEEFFARLEGARIPRLVGLRPPKLGPHLLRDDE